MLKLFVALTNVVNVVLSIMGQQTVHFEGTNRVKIIFESNVANTLHNSPVRDKCAKSFKMTHVNLVLNADINMPVGNAEDQKGLKPAVDAVSSCKGMEPVQVLNSSYWRSTLAEIYPSHKCSEIIYKLNNGVAIGRNAAERTIESPNWPSASQFYHQVSESIKIDVEQGRVLGPLKNPPFQNYIVSPLGAFLKRDGSKVRVIHDLSYPVHDSVNASIDPNDFSLKYASIDDAVRMCKHYKEPPYFAKIDLKDAYKHVPVQKADWHMLGVKWPDERGNFYYYFYKVLNFGLRSAPYLFDIFANCLQDFMTHEGASDHTVRYVDDFLTIGATSAECAHSTDIMLHTCTKAGFKVQMSKVTKPHHIVEFLGIIIDGQKRELRISSDRMYEINTLLQDWAGKATCTKRQLLQLIGKLAFASRVVRMGRAFLGRLIQLSKKPKHLHHKVRIGSSARADIRWWTQCLATHNGITMFEEDWSAANYLDCFTDASDWGYGAVIANEWIAMSYTGDIAPLKGYSINWRELHAACKALVTWAPVYRSRHILFHIDNSSVCCILNKLYTPIPEMMELVRLWCTTVEQFQIKVCVVYISTHLNTVADALSRGAIDKAKELMPASSRQVWPQPIQYYDKHI